MTFIKAFVIMYAFSVGHKACGKAENRGVAQLVARCVRDAKVVGSNPVASTKSSRITLVVRLLFYSAACDGIRGWEPFCGSKTLFLAVFGIQRRLTEKAAIDNCRAGRAAKGANPERSCFAIPSLRFLRLDQKQPYHVGGTAAFLFRGMRRDSRVGAVLREQNALPNGGWITVKLTAKDDVDNVGAGRAAKGANPGRSCFAIPSLRFLRLDQSSRIALVVRLLFYSFPT